MHRVVTEPAEVGSFRLLGLNRRTSAYVTPRTRAPAYVTPRSRECRHRADDHGRPSSRVQWRWNEAVYSEAR